MVHRGFDEDFLWYGRFQAQSLEFSGQAFLYLGVVDTVIQLLIEVACVQQYLLHEDDSDQSNHYKHQEKTEDCSADFFYVSHQVTPLKSDFRQLLALDQFSGHDIPVRCVSDVIERITSVQRQNLLFGGRQNALVGPAFDFDIADFINIGSIGQLEADIVADLRIPQSLEDGIGVPGNSAALGRCIQNWADPSAT